MRSSVEQLGFRASQFDIATGGPSEDITSKAGFYSLVLMGLRLVQFALIVAGPPCSMFIFLSSSQHQRHIWGPCGNPFDRATQLANLIASNTVLWLVISRHCVKWLCDALWHYYILLRLFQKYGIVRLTSFYYVLLLTRSDKRVMKSFNTRSITRYRASDLKTILLKHHNISHIQRCN